MTGLIRNGNEITGMSPEPANEAVEILPDGVQNPRFE
jgi:hypothetical protein